MLRFVNAAETILSMRRCKTFSQDMAVDRGYLKCTGVVECLPSPTSPITREQEAAKQIKAKGQERSQEFDEASVSEAEVRSHLLDPQAHSPRLLSHMYLL